ncbi:MAG: hypothetical protein KKF20_01290 [Bacteroidetes bacterium]|nr:hypothetical protein [Bacteroidota bacterium]
MLRKWVIITHPLYECVQKVLSLRFVYDCATREPAKLSRFSRLPPKANVWRAGEFSSIPTLVGKESNEKTNLLDRLYDLSTIL